MFRADFLSDSHGSRDSRSTWLEGQRGRRESSELQSRGLRTKRGSALGRGAGAGPAEPPLGGAGRAWPRGGCTTSPVSPRRGGLVLETGVAVKRRAGTDRVWDTALAYVASLWVLALLHLFQ